jgi:hypothetical protein
MAGAGRKTFVAGDVLTASDVNSYLMDQAVMRFASASARSTAISSPSEGMMSYLDDTNAVEVYDGSAWTSVTGTEIPYAMAVLAASFGSLNIPPYADGATGGAATVTFPAGKFSVPPVVIAQTRNGSIAARAEYAKWSVDSVTASAVTFFLMNAGPASAATGGGNMTEAVGYFIATQYASGSATG